MAEPALLPDPVASPPPAAASVSPPAVAPESPAVASGSPALRVVHSPTGGLTRPVPRLEIPAYDMPAALSLERELGVSHVLAQVLVRRGLSDPAAARAFLDATEEHPSTAFRGMERVLDVMQRHIRTGSRITVHGDYDVDGVCATAILVRALRSLGGEVDWYLPDRLSDGYGLSLATVRRLADRGTRLVLTADCAITAVEEVEGAAALGLEVIVTDHHQVRPDGRLPDCPIVHPVVCGYPCADLCGTGVAYKLARALDVATADEDLELVALATVADLMPLRGENRRLVRQGLKALAMTARPGLRALMDVSGADPSALDAQTLGFRLAPRINAAGRLRRADAGLELLLTEDPGRAAEIAAELDLVNSERRAVEQRILWQAEAQASELGDRSAFVLAGEEWHPGVVGIVASRIAERYHRPAVLVARRLDAPCQGSARSIPGFDLLGGLQACSAHLERFGGHRAAAGLTIRSELIDAFRHSFEAFVESVLTPELRMPVERVDAVVSGSQLGLSLIDELERLEPSGIGNPRSRLLVPGARFGDVRPMGEGRHARFTVAAGGTRSPAVAFGCDGRLPAAPGEPVDATFRLERNCWNGAVSPRLVLRCAWPCAPAPIEVLGEPDDYLRAVLDELEVPLAPGRREASGPDVASGTEMPRTVLDRRGESPLAVLADTVASGGAVLAVCSEVTRRLAGLASRAGGFSLISYHSLAREPSVAADFPQVVALDPPACEAYDRLLREGSGVTHLAWGGAELRFAQQMHELEYGLRASLVALYRALRLRRRVAGEELERLLRGESPHGRPARLAGRLIRVLAELELVSLDPELPALAIAGVAPTALDRSPSYRVYAKRHEDGRRYLNSANPRPSG